MLKRWFISIHKSRLRQEFAVWDHAMFSGTLPIHLPYSAVYAATCAHRRRWWIYEPGFRNSKGGSYMLKRWLNSIHKSRMRQEFAACDHAMFSGTLPIKLLYSAVYAATCGHCRRSLVNERTWFHIQKSWIICWRGGSSRYTSRDCVKNLRSEIMQCSVERCQSIYRIVQYMPRPVRTGVVDEWTYLGSGTAKVDHMLKRWLNSIHKSRMREEFAACDHAMFSGTLPIKLLYSAVYAATCGHCRRSLVNELETKIRL
jgi:cell division protein FtsL